MEIFITSPSDKDSYKKNCESSLKIIFGQSASDSFMVLTPPVSFLLCSFERKDFAFAFQQKNLVSFKLFLLSQTFTLHWSLICFKVARLIFLLHENNYISYN